MISKRLIFAAAASTIIGCGLTDQAEPVNLQCPSWTFKTEQHSLSGALATITKLEGQTIIHFDQDPTQDDIKAGTLVAPQDIPMKLGEADAEFTLFMQQTPWIWSSSTKEDGGATNYIAPTLTIHRQDDQLVSASITGQIRTLDVATRIESVERFSLSFKAMAPNVEIPAECYKTR